MKKYMYIFLLLISLLIVLLNPLVIAEDPIVVFIDAGHGGVDKGARVGDILESDLNLSVSLKLKEILEEKGMKVLLTRSGDYDLSTDKEHRKRTDAISRINMINNSNCDLFLSIHMNTFANANYAGAQVFYTNMNEKNYLLAKSVEQSFQQNLNSKRKSSTISGIYMLDRIKKPGCLIEAGFMTNKEELKLLLTEEYQTQIAYSIYYGIYSYLILM